MLPFRINAAAMCLTWDISARAINRLGGIEGERKRMHIPHKGEDDIDKQVCTNANCDRSRGSAMRSRRGGGRPLPMLSRQRTADENGNRGHQEAKEPNDNHIPLFKTGSLGHCTVKDLECLSKMRDVRAKSEPLCCNALSIQLAQSNMQHHALIFPFSMGIDLPMLGKCGSRCRGSLESGSQHSLPLCVE